jgi:hypothetical protein
MNPFGLVSFVNPSAPVVFGGYASYDAALAAAANAVPQQTFSIAPCFGPATVPPTTPLTLQSLSPGAYVAVYQGFSASGNVQTFLYGTFGNLAEAQQWIAQQGAYAGSYVAAPVYTAI